MLFRETGFSVHFVDFLDGASGVSWIMGDRTASERSRGICFVDRLMGVSKEERGTDWGGVTRGRVFGLFGDFVRSRSIIWAFVPYIATPEALHRALNWTWLSFSKGISLKFMWAFIYKSRKSSKYKNKGFSIQSKAGTSKKTLGDKTRVF